MSRLLTRQGGPQTIASIVCAISLAAQSGSTEGTPMRAVRKVGVAGCSPPSFGCVQVVNTTRRPSPGPGEVLVRVTSSGINPDEVSLLELPAIDYTLGIDLAGIVEEVGPACSGRIKVGDRVWATGIKGGMAEYAVRIELAVGVLPPAPTRQPPQSAALLSNSHPNKGSAVGALLDPINMKEVGTVPTVGMTVLGALRSAGAPWPQSANTTIIITAGTGGTGYVAVQLARAMGARRIITAATGEGIPFARSLGADVCVDYTTTSVYNAVPQGSVNIVLSNHKSNSTAERAMAMLGANPEGGVYVTLDGDMAPSTPPRVTQVDYDLFDPSEMAKATEYLDTLAAMVVNRTLVPHVQQQFGFEGAQEALGVMAAGRVLSKLAVVP
eukprot:m.19065 g.19065  ORF g.19065 m.19065 type:complete len:383 (+) comp5393_c0_seq1:37-1185(+)